MKTVTLGMTDLEVTPVAFGTWQLGGDWGAFDEGEAISAIRHARELGINFFDTAQAYGFGASERLLGRALRDELATRRDEVVIATKGGLRIDQRQGLVRDSSPAWLRHGVEESLRALGVDYIDLYQVHWPDPATPFAETAEALGDLVWEGKIRPCCPGAGRLRDLGGEALWLSRLRAGPSKEPPARDCGSRLGHCLQSPLSGQAGSTFFRLTVQP